MNEIELEFTKLVREYRKTIYTVCYFFSDNPTEVEDLFQIGGDGSLLCKARQARAP